MTSVIRQRWQTRELVGDKQHALIVRVRPGFMNRGYLSTRRIDDGSTPFNGSPIFPPWIYQGINIDCWKGEWHPVGPWMELPEVVSVKWSRDFDIQTGGAKGVGAATIVMDNVGYPDVTGIAGIYHAIVRGFYSPERGVTPTGRSNPWPEDVQNDWKDVLNAGYQVEVWEGYGIGADIELKTVIDPTTNSYAPDSGALDRTFTGIIVDCDTDTHPDKITLSAPDFGVYLTDQRLMGRNKAIEIRSPVTFADRRRIQGEEKLSGPLKFSSGSITPDGVWQSQDDGSQGDVEWIEITLPKGYYTEFFVAPLYDGMEMFVSVYCNGDGKYDRVHTLTTGWVDFGAGTVPGGGPAYIRDIGTLPDSPTHKWQLGYGFDLPQGSLLRLSFTHLRGVGGGNYRAGTNDVAAYRYGTDPLNPAGGAPGVNAHHWILVEDAAEVVRMLLIWAGFQEWHVEEFSWTLHFPMVFGEDKTMMDVIDQMLQQGSFCFYMGPPTNDDRSIGVPHFEHVHALDSAPAQFSVRDTDMTEALQVKWDLKDLPWVMRYRGAIDPSGQTLFQDRVKRFMATYYPPWIGPDKYRALGPTAFTGPTHIRRTAGITRHFTETMGLTTTAALDSNVECLFACILAAIQYGLNMRPGRFQMPGLSRLKLNDHAAVIDEASAVNSRMWVTSIESDHQRGKWTMTVGGSLIDFEDMDALVADYNVIWKLNQQHKSSF